MAVVRMTVKQPAKLISANRVNGAIETAEGRIDGEIPAENIAGGAVTEAKIGAGAVTVDKLADGAVSAAKLAAGAVTAAKLMAGAAMLKAVHQALKTATQAVTAARTWTAVTDLTLTVTTATAEKVLLVASLAVAGSGVSARIIRDGNPVTQGDAAATRTRTMSGGGTGTAILLYCDAPGAGTHTYAVEVVNMESSGTVYVNRGESDADSPNSPRSVSVLLAIPVEEA